MLFSQTPHTTSGGGISAIYVGAISVIFIQDNEKNSFLLLSDYGNDVSSGQATA